MNSGYIIKIKWRVPSIIKIHFMLLISYSFRFRWKPSGGCWPCFSQEVLALLLLWGSTLSSNRYTAGTSARSCWKGSEASLEPLANTESVIKTSEWALMSLLMLKKSFTNALKKQVTKSPLADVCPPLCINVVINPCSSWYMLSNNPTHL